MASTEWGGPSVDNNSSRSAALVSFALVALFMCVNRPLHAQTVSGTILGTVQDQQGAVVAKADVTARNLDNGAVRKATSDDFGNYRIESVPAGPYEVSS